MNLFWISFSISQSLLYDNKHGCLGLNHLESLVVLYRMVCTVATKWLHVPFENVFQFKRAASKEHIKKQTGLFTRFKKNYIYISKASLISYRITSLTKHPQRGLLSSQEQKGVMEPQGGSKCEMNISIYKCVCECVWSVMQGISLCPGPAAGSESIGWSYRVSPGSPTESSLFTIYQPLVAALL